MGISTSGTPSLPTLVRWSPTCRVLCAVCFIYFLLSSISLIKLGPKSGPLPKLALSAEDGSWLQISPSKTLIYHPCYDGLRCARLELPLDWQNTTASAQTVAVALLKIPARVPVTDPRYGGPIFINPGGPGGSGVQKVMKNGRQIQIIVDAPEGTESSTVDTESKYFDIVGFDPRGIGYSTPKLECFPDYYARQGWVSQSKAEGILGSSDTAFDMKWARWQSLSKSCMDEISREGEDSIAYHMNITPLIADMVALAERHGEWREAQAKAWLSSFTGEFQTLFGKNARRHGRTALLDRSRWRRGQEKLLYWGFSYGTLIGQTFAATHPERISRFVLDAVVLPEGYFNGNWTPSIGDADATFDKFFEYCSESGSEKCPFYTDKDPRSIKRRYYELLSSLKADPIPVPASKTRAPDIITSSDVKFEVKEALYCPLQKYPPLAQQLSDLSYNNGSLLADVKHARMRPFHLPDRCKRDGPFSLACQKPGGWEDEASAAIHCPDAEGGDGITKASYKKYVDMLTNQSVVMGYTWAEIRMPCIGWKIRPKWKYEGLLEANTSHPILFIGNTLDPATPISNAFQVSRNFPGSVVLQQDSAGHSSLSSPSLCTGKAIRNYFQTGELPEPKTICKPNEYPFIGLKSGLLLGKDETLLGALREAASHCRS